MERDYLSQKWKQLENVSNTYKVIVFKTWTRKRRKKTAFQEAATSKVTSKVFPTSYLRES